MGITNDILQGKGRPPLTRADVLERLQQAHAAGTSLNLAGETLIGSNLSTLDLRGANFSGADLRGADLIRANLIRANLSGGDLRKANLNRANLNRANLNRANLSEAYLNRANLSEANLSEANLSGGDLSGADLIEANLIRANLSRANLSGAYLNKAYLSEANLSGAYLIKAYLSGTYLNGANLSGAYLSEANLSGAYLSEANLSGAYLNRANLSGAYLAEVDLSKVELNGAILQNVIIVDNAPNINAETITLQIRVEDEPFSSHHLAKTVATFRSLLTRLWLLQQGRLEDFEHYTQKQDRHLENEVPLSIRFSVNSHANILFNFDWSPKGLVEAFQQLVNIFLLWKQRHHKGELRLKQQQRQIAEQSLVLAQHLVEAVAPNLADEQKGAAIESVLKDIHASTKDASLEISLLHPQRFKP